MTDDRPDITQEAALAALDGAFQAFAIRFRKDVGRPMEEREWLLARLAHADGYTEGVQDGIRLASEADSMTAADAPERQEG